MKVLAAVAITAAVVMSAVSLVVSLTRKTTAQNTPACTGFWCP